MAQSSEIKSQIDALLGQINPRLDQLPGAEQYYKDRVNQAYNYNLEPLTNAANIEAKMYSMPGDLMSQYDQEFGGKTGVSASQRINSILGQLGRQGAMANTAWGLADQSGARINDLANSLLNQYKTGIEADQMKLSPLMSMWDRMFAEEQANERARLAASRGGGGGSSGINWGDIKFSNQPTPEQIAELQKKNKAWNAGADKAWEAAEKKKKQATANQTIQGYFRPDVPPVADTGSALLNQYVNQFRGIEQPWK